MSYEIVFYVLAPCGHYFGQYKSTISTYDYGKISFSSLVLLYVLNSMSFQRLNNIVLSRNIINHVVFNFVLTLFK